MIYSQTVIGIFMKRKSVFFILAFGGLVLLSVAVVVGGRMLARENLYPAGKEQIPKVIHYVWLGSKELSPKAKECVASWKKYHPDFKIQKWDEESCDINSNPFVKGAYERKRYDFASDYCRVKALQDGGIYFDTDMLLKGPVDFLLNEPLVLTLQRKNELSASFMAVVPNHPFVQALRKNYENRLGFDDSELYNAPFTWTITFWEVFQQSASLKREEGKYHIVAPNILMYDFKGGEAVAEHLFGANSWEGHQLRWYNWFRKIYLEQFALYIVPKNKYFIFKDDENGYYYDPEQKTAGPSLGYTFKNNILVIQEPEKLHLMMCVSQHCDDQKAD